MACTLRGAPARPRAIMARGVRLPRAAGRPPRFLRTGHRRATSRSEAHLQHAQRDAGHALGREAEGVLQSLLFRRASRGLRAQSATFRVLVEGDSDVDATFASAVGCSPGAEVADAAPATALRPEGPCCAKVRRCPDCPKSTVRAVLPRLLIGQPKLGVVSTAVGRGPRLQARCRAKSRPAPPGGGEVPRSGNRT